MTPAQFIAKWSRAELSERAASQEHFIDLCRLLGQPTPAEHDATGAEYTFEKGVSVTGAASARSSGERGFADVWWRGKFGWEYKRKGRHETLADAYRQLLQYREALENPPLLIVCDIDRIEIHTNFTGTKKDIIAIPLDGIGHPDHLSILRRVFTDPDSFKPSLTTWKLTEQAAADFAKIADGLRQRRHDPHTAAHFLMKCMFCLFAEDVKLLPDRLFSKLLERGRDEPEKLTDRLTALFRTMSTGGDFGADTIAWFNGGLFDDSPALKLNVTETVTMLVAAQHDWGAVEPAIFGTLFERSLDPGKRAQIGAHYTSRDDIMLIVEPVVMAPLRREWQARQDEVNALIQKRREAAGKAAKTKADAAIAEKLDEFLHRLSSVRILDPACGSGNFLYVAIQQLLALEKEVIIFAGRPEIGLGLFPKVRPTQLYGIEINPYAAELAQVVIWIGYLQWMRDNGFPPSREPILTPLKTIECRDAILDFTIPSKPQPAKWPEADFIIGNPPFLGVRLFRRHGLDDGYIQAMYDGYRDLPNSIDLCCYWFELARRAIEHRAEVRVGLLATQGIRGGDNRTVLERVKETGDIFMGWSDREWILDGAAVHVSLVGFDSGSEKDRHLDGKSVGQIIADLTAGENFTTAIALRANSNLAFQGPVKVGDFDVDLARARAMLARPNPRECGNSDVVRRWIRGEELNGRCEPTFIIDFAETAMEEAARYEAPFEYVAKHVKSFRMNSKDKSRKQNWWRLGRSGAEFKEAVGRTSRYLASCQTAKYRILTWQPASSLPAQTVIAIARQDDYFFGVLHSSVHELWARRMGTQLREAESGFRYTPTTCFETFPLPWPPGLEPTTRVVGRESEPTTQVVASAAGRRKTPTRVGGSDAHAALHARISDAARELNEQRERWLNPPEWIDELAASIDRRDDFADVPADARPLIRHSAIMAAAAEDKRLKKRTLTNLYNERPTWLRLAHEKLDRAVLAAYAAVDPEGGWSEDWAEVWVETGAGQPLPPAEDGTPHKLTQRRREIDQAVLANLLRMNLTRAGNAG